jgi:hypothetical protein
VHASRPREINASAAAKSLSVTYGFAIVPDARLPGMYRIRRPDGTLTQMVNLKRAKDALRALDDVHRVGQFYADAVGGEST